jgi:ribose transport system substrate-binding protein
MKLSSKRIKAGLAVASSISLVLGASLIAAPAQAAGTYKIGVSNSWAGNSWRETMVCAIKAQASLSGKLQASLFFHVTQMQLVNQLISAP